MARVRIRTRWISLIVAVAVLLAVLIPTALTQRRAAASAAAIALAPTAGVVGTNVQVSGSGFGHKETVKITFDGTLVATTTATSAATFATSFAVPLAIPPGSHSVTATGAKTGRSSSAAFQVVAQPASNWTQLGYSAAGGRSNPFESALTTSTVAQLAPDWSAVLGGGGGIPGSAVANGVVYADDGTGIDALDAATGKLLWFASTMGGGDTASNDISPAVDSGVVYAGGGDNRIYAFDAQTGATRWIFTPNGQILSSPTVTNGVVYITSREGHVFALDGASGAMRWSFQVGVGDGVDQTPAVANGVVYFTSDNGIAYALDAGTGAQLWQVPIGSSWEGINVAAVDNGVVFLIVGAPNPSTQGEVVALDAASGAIKWIANTAFLGTNGVALANGTIFVSTVSTGMYAFDEATGALKWQVPVAMSFSAPAIANGVVYVGAGTAYLYAFDAATGATLATVGNCGTQPDSSPIVASGVVYIGCANTFAAFHLPGTTP